MAELLTRLTGEEFIGFVAVVGGFLTAIVGIWAYNWRLARVAEVEGQLKREMVSQGRSGAEIAEVVRAQASPPWVGLVCQRRQSH